MITVRTAQKSDMALLVQFYKNLFSAADSGDSEETNIFAKPDNAVSAYLNSLRGEFVLAFKAGSLVGALNINRKNKILYDISLFAILNEYRQEGAATTMLNFVEHKLQAPAKVEVKCSDMGLKKFFESKGYAVEGKLSNHFGWGKTAYILGKSFQRV